jgi:hypothetical protein
VLRGTSREEQDRMIHFKSYYDFASNYCNVAKGNEKGSVENGVGYAKRRYLSGNFNVRDFDELRHYLMRRITEDLHDIHYKEKKEVEDLLAEEKTSFLKIPDIPYDCSKKIITKSTKTLYVEYDGVKYSIPSEYCQKAITLKASCDEIIISCSDKEIAKHTRAHKAFQKEVYDFRHYLPALYKKPRALDNAKCIKNASFPKIFWTYLAELKNRSFDANRDMVRILLLHKHYDIKNIFFAMEWGHTNKAYSYDTILMTIKELKREKTKPETIKKIYPTVTVNSTGLDKYNTLLGGTIC